MKVLLTMVTWDRLDYTKKALGSLLDQDHDFKLHIVDNGSSDGTQDYLKGLTDKRIKVTLWDTNKGLSTATDYAFEEEADFYGRVDNDVIIPPDWLSRCIEAHKQADFGFIGGFHFREEDLPDKPLIEIFDGVEIWRKPHIGGCSFLIKGSDYRKFGKIGGDLVMGLTDYQHKFLNAGLINGYLYPFIWVDHMEDGRSPHNIKTEEYQNHSLRVRNMSVEDYTSQFKRDAQSYLSNNYNI